MTNRRTPALARRGLTLMELIVVLVILVALASILIPMLPGMISRAHTSSGATNNSELNKFVQTHEQLYLSYPNNLDALTDSAGTAVADYVPNGATQLTTHALTADEATALTTGGVTTLAAMVATQAGLGAGQDPTFNPYDTATPTITVATGANVVQVSEAAVEGAGGLVVDSATNAGDVYVVFGVGRANTMIGRTMAQAPLHFGEGGADTPNNKYARLGLVFRITKGGATPTPLERAQFVGVVAFHDDGITTGDGHLQEYYESSKAAQ